MTLFRTERFIFGPLLKHIFNRQVIEFNSTRIFNIYFALHITFNYNLMILKTFLEKK